MLTLLLGVDFNLERLYRREPRESVEAMPPAEGFGGLLRKVYAAVYAPHDRLVEAFVRWRVRRLRADAAARLAYHDRSTLAVLHNFGLSSQMAALAVCLAFTRPDLYFWLVLGCGVALLPLELRRELRVLRARRATPVVRQLRPAASAAGDPR